MPSGPTGTNLNTVIGTHDGVFHADDVMAVAALTIVTPSATIVRTRDPARLADCQIVVDVGGVFDASTGRFDHHQKGRAGDRPNGVLYSSFGLIWREFGQALIRALTEGRLDGEQADAVYAIVDRELVQPVDAIDNGQALYEGGEPSFAGVTGVSLSSVLSGFNPAWNEGGDFDRAFGGAVAVAQTVISNAVRSAVGDVLARSIVRAAIEASKRGPVVVLDRFAPWGDQVRDDAPEALFVVFPSETGTWMVQAIQAVPGTFQSRKLLPEAWAGLRDEEFSVAVGISDGVFCHPGRFIGGAKTRESALKLAAMAVG